LGGSNPDERQRKKWECGVRERNEECIEERHE
jgi:hypothetical protein